MENFSWDVGAGKSVSLDDRVIGKAEPTVVAAGIGATCASVGGCLRWELGPY